MLKWAWLGLLALWSVSFQQGCQDVKKALTHLNYYPIRDMRQTVAIDPQRGWFPGPDSLSVPTIGKDRYANEGMPYEVAKTKFSSPFAPDEASVARGDTLFNRFCVTCHGKDMSGIGPVTDLYLPAANLLGENARSQPDGYLYLYMRHGGAIMPAYGNALSAHDAWDVVHFIRHQQKVTPP